MIKELHISNLAVIEDTLLCFESSYLALVGETGAGKSLVVDSLGLIKGDKSDFSLVRDPSLKASVTASFSLSPDFIKKHNEIKDYVDVNGDLIAKRVLYPDHSNRSFLNDEPVTLGHYREAISHLIDIHSQGANSSLLDESRHLFYLDQYGYQDEKNALNDYQISYQKLLQAKKELADLLDSHKELDRDYLDFQIKEIEKYDLKENEIEDLNAEFESLKGYQAVKTRYDEYLEAASLPEGTITDLIETLETKLDHFSDTSLSQEASVAREKCQDLINSLASFKDSFEALDSNPQRLDEINQRLFDLKGLQRKYGKSTNDILEKLKDYKEKVSQLDSFETLKNEKEKQVKACLAEANQKAQVLSDLRKKTGPLLEKAISSQMGDLGLNKNGFKVSFEKTELNENGFDKVTFLVGLNAGLGYQPLAKAASGGENSRLMLALKTVLNSLDPYDLLVFDEIDTGVSGRIASLVAKKISSLSSSSQILVISHLPQVVASSFNQLLITKTTKDQKTFTTARPLNALESVREVAKMISGDQVTDSALTQAQELIKEYRKK
jgi:DNA repair protein RecN (Recombination protein N)